MVVLPGMAPVMAAGKPENFYSSGYTSFTQGKFEAAATAYQQAVKLNPENGIYHVALGCALGQTGQYRAAIY
jgi:Flp pilus assembly protein TadD